MCALLASLSFGRTCYRVACQGDQPSFLDLCDSVKDMSPATWLQLKAECRRAVKDQKADSRQTLIHLWHSELREFLEGMWSARSFSKTPSDPDFVVHFADLPATIVNKRCCQWNNTTEEIEFPTLLQHQSSTLLLTRTLVIVGQPGYGKTSLMLALACRQTLMMKKERFAIVDEPDNYGALVLLK